ncbi:uncharacterized protein EV154DRAFT_488297 [Mucor mucedo]|uniref:uncharacterized protein n=1 Tax=Mucor mucedo TaxID=29922 RepID=UPI00221E744C|nr:uncharacterized protein EV154DRAFT_488297 [Mucor mucedo]KAI7867616.1 hypothetical protein EV154DRAFT_488297 [Mucor mucedo]
MPEVQLNNRSDRRVAQRFDAKRQSKREKQMIKASPNASKYNGKKNRKKVSRQSQIATTTPIASVKPRVTTPSGDTSVPVEMSLVHQQPAKQQSGQEHDSSFETETNLPVQEQAVFELEEEQMPEILDEEVFDVEEETSTEGEDTVEKEVLADKSSIISTPKEELIMETTSSLENEKDNQAVDNKVNQKQDDGLSDKNITAQQEEPRSNESADTVQKSSQASKNDTIQNKQMNKESYPTQWFVFPETDITNSPAVSIELTTVSPTKKKNVILRLFKKSAAHIIEKNKRVKKELLHTKQLVFSKKDITNSSVASIDRTKESPAKKTNIISRLYKKSVKACDMFINDQIQLIGKANRIGIISNKKTNPKKSFKNLLKR